MVFISLTSVQTRIGPRLDTEMLSVAVYALKRMLDVARQGAHIPCTSVELTTKTCRRRIFFCTGKGAVCAERHKSPEMNSINGVSRYEPDPERHTNQKPKPNQPKKQHAPKQASTTKNQTRKGQAHVRSSCEPQKMMIRRSGTRGSELVFLAALSSECPS